MRSGRVLAGVLLAVAAFVYACTSFQPAQEEASDAGRDADPAGRPLADGGSFIWETHSSATGIMNIRSSVALARHPNGGVVVAAAVASADASLGDTPLTPGGAVIVIDGANQVTRTMSIRTRIIEDLAVDSLGDIYVIGNYGTETAFPFPLENKDAAAFPAAIASGTVGYVAKLNGTSGKAAWAWAIDATEDAGASASQSAGRSIATNGQDVVALFQFTGLARFTDNGGESATARASTDYDGLVLPLVPSDGRALWWKRLGGGTNTGDQSLLSVRFDGTNVLAGGVTAGDLLLGGDPDSGLVSPSPGKPSAVFVDLDGTSLAHQVLGGRVLASEGDFAASVSLAAEVASNGDVILCGRHRNTDKLDGVSVKNRGFDGFVARYAKGSRERIWLRSFGGTLDDECTSIAIAANGEIVMVVNHASGAVDVEGVKLTDPPGANQVKSAIVRLSSDGTRVVWVRDVAGSGPTWVAKVVIGANDDIFYSGYATGPVDLGRGEVAAGASPTFFVVRVSP